MRITLLLANCEPPLLKQSVQTVIDVLTELEVEIQRVDLHKLPYYSSEGSPVMDAIIKALDNSEAVIAISNVVMYGLHGAMQSFFDHCTLYPHVYFDKPLFAITYSNWLGEYEGAQQILRSWNTIGGVDAGCVCLNKVQDSSVALSRLEKEVENFYRIVRQGKANIGCSARAYYYKAMEGKEVMPHNNKTVSTTNNNINNKPVTINNQIKADKVVPVNTNEAIENSSSPYGNNDKQAPIPPTIIKATDNQSGVREFNTVANDKIYPPQVDDVNDIPIMTNPNRSYSAYKKNNQNFQNELFNKDKANDAHKSIADDTFGEDFKELFTQDTTSQDNTAAKGRTLRNPNSPKTNDNNANVNANVKANSNANSNSVNSKAKEQAIKDIAQLIDSKGQELSNVSSRPTPPRLTTGSTPPKLLGQIPHYFNAHHDKDLDLVLKYDVTDTNEEGYIIIKDGDCIFADHVDVKPTIEIMLDEEVLNNIIHKKFTYQKAFMLGKIKVKGNFSILPRLDQVFTK